MNHWTVYGMLRKIFRRLVAPLIRRLRQKSEHASLSAHQNTWERQFRGDRRCCSIGCRRWSEPIHDFKSIELTPPKIAGQLWANRQMRVERFQEINNEIDEGMMSRHIFWNPIPDSLPSKWSNYVNRHCLGIPVYHSKQDSNRQNLQSVMVYATIENTGESLLLSMPSEIKLNSQRYLWYE